MHSLGLTGGNATLAALQHDFLAPLGELSRIDSAQELVKSFTQVFAAQIHSRPETGVLNSGGSFSFPVGRYVTAVLVNMASSGRSGSVGDSLNAIAVDWVTNGEQVVPRPGERWLLVTSAMAIERLAPRGREHARAVGVVAVVLGAIMLGRAAGRT